MRRKDAAADLGLGQDAPLPRAPFKAQHGGINVERHVVHHKDREDRRRDVEPEARPAFFPPHAALADVDHGLRIVRAVAPRRQF
jgi:hypothetical protein